MSDGNDMFNYCLKRFIIALVVSSIVIVGLAVFYSVGF